MNLQSIFRDLGMKLGVWLQGVTLDMHRSGVDPFRGMTYEEYYEATRGIGLTGAGGKHWIEESISSNDDD